MDEEDLADLEESRKLQTREAFSGLGSTADDAVRASGLMGLFRVEGETMGVKLLKKMGWKEGQGIGPKVRRKARLGLSSDANITEETHLFAPDNVPMISFVRKTDHKGLGYAGETGLTPLSKANGQNESDEEDEDDGGIGSLGRPRFSLTTERKKGPQRPRGSIGVGILNDTGSDDEDPYELGPKISYNRVIGGDKQKKKTATATNPTLKSKPTFVSSKSKALGKVALGVRKCHDGRLPLDGFVFGKEPDPLISEIIAEGKYPPPRIPPGWVSSKKPTSSAKQPAGYVSTAEAAKSSTLDPRARAAILGEKQLPGKSVFDFLSPEARERLVAATGKKDLPPARGEVPAEYALSEDERLKKLLAQVPRLDKETAVAAITRGASGAAPYADDEAKRSRYLSFLEWQAGFKSSPGARTPKMKDDDWLRELHEFYNCARIFKPMTGFMASRFTTSSAAKPGSSSDGGASNNSCSQTPTKPQDPTEEAAKLGMFGPMTRTVTEFYPSRLLCKRFGVNPPEHVRSDEYPANKSRFDASSIGGCSAASTGPTEEGTKPAWMPTGKAVVVVDPSRNEALEAKRAGEEVFKAVFGDSGDEG